MIYIETEKIRRESEKQRLSAYADSTRQQSMKEAVDYEERGEKR